MNTSEKFFDTKMIANFIVVFAVIVSAFLYVKYADEIEKEVAAVVVSSLNDIDNSLAQQGSK